MANDRVVQDYPKVRIRLHGPGAPYTVVGPATKIKYGRHKDGDVFWIHAADQQFNPEMYVLVADGSNDEVGSIPEVPEQVRAPSVPRPAPPPPLKEDVVVDDVDVVDFDFVEEEEHPKPKPKKKSTKKKTTTRKTKSATSK